MNLLAYYNITPRADWLPLSVQHSWKIWHPAQVWMAPLHQHSATELDHRCDHAQCNVIVVPTGCLITDYHKIMTIPAGECDNAIFGVMTNHIRFDHDVTIAIYFNN